MLTVVAEDAYPSDFPFASDKASAELFSFKFPEANPSFKFDASDPGGYTNLLLKCDLGALYKTYGSKQFGAALCPGMRYNLAVNPSAAAVDTTGMTADKAIQTIQASANFNCSNNPFSHNVSTGVPHSLDYLYVKYFKKDMHTALEFGFGPTGIDKNVKWCKSKSECCEELQPFAGVRAFTKIGEYQKEAENNQCSSATLPLTCNRLQFTAYLCQEQYISAGKRLKVPLCPDHRMRYYASCKKITDLWGNMATKDDNALSEPATYKLKLTQRQVYESFSLTKSPDKVCKPYSYYFPAAAAKSTATPAKSTATSAKSVISAAPATSQATTTSAASATGLHVMLFAAAITLMLC